MGVNSLSLYGIVYFHRDGLCFLFKEFLTGDGGVRSLGRQGSYSSGFLLHVEKNARERNGDWCRLGTKRQACDYLTCGNAQTQTRQSRPIGSLLG